MLVKTPTAFFRLILSLALAASSAPAAAQTAAPKIKKKAAAKPAAENVQAAGASLPAETGATPLVAQAGRTAAASLAGAGTVPPPPAEPPTVVTAPSGAFPMLPAVPGVPTEERIQLDKITTLNTIEQQKFQQKVRALVEERDELALKNMILAERLRAEMAPLEHEQKKLQIKGQMEDEKAGQLASALRFQRDRLRLENDLAREKLGADQIKAETDRLKMEVAVRELDFQSRKLKHEAELAENKTVAIKSDLELRDKKDAWKKQANREPDYLKEPFKSGVLTISDRRIPLDGPIVYGSADFVTERIHYFNNKSEEFPIFIVIDRSPGGSVMEGYRILKAMQASKAPVYVVVKSFAASMAATIATLAPRSFAYPNAVILHHQVMSVLSGNPTQQKQQLDILKEWDRRLREPIARKMGKSMDKFTAEMYERNVDGDWEEFADSAVKLKWVDHVVHEIRETGILKEPDVKLEDKPKLAFGMAEESDTKGERFVRLPRLQHSDAYFIHNRDGYYR